MRFNFSLSRAVLDPPATVVIPFSEETLRPSSLKRRKSVVLRPSKAEAVLTTTFIKCSCKEKKKKKQLSGANRSEVIPVSGLMLILFPFATDFR